MERRRRKGASGFSLVNITLVLFFVGVFAFIAIAFNKVVDEARGEQEMKLILNDFVSESKGKALAEQLAEKDFVDTLRYVSKEEALEDFMTKTGDDFNQAMDNMNPLPASINVQLADAYINGDSVRKISRELLRNHEFKEVDYPIVLIDTVNKRANLLKIIAAVLGIILLGVAFFLLLNTVRLAIYSQRMLIRSMQLVGATEQFIRKPFLRIGITQGLIGAAIAGLLLLLLLLGANFLINRNARVLDLSFLVLSVEFYLLLGMLLIFGGSIGWISSRVAVDRYLNKKMEDVV